TGPALVGQQDTKVPGGFVQPGGAARGGPGAFAAWPALQKHEQRQVVVTFPGAADFAYEYLEGTTIIRAAPVQRHFHTAIDNVPSREGIFLIDHGILQETDPATITAPGRYLAPRRTGLWERNPPARIRCMRPCPACVQL